jgi:site-specific DNA-methyltransferase (adenine-specific)
MLWDAWELEVVRGVDCGKHQAADPRRARLAAPDLPLTTCKSGTFDDAALRVYHYPSMAIHSKLIDERRHPVLREVCTQRFDAGDGYVLVQGNCLDVLPCYPEACVDMVFADPPYFLSNNGITCQSGEMVSVNKGKWDESMGVERNHAFVLSWLQACRRVLKDDGTIWVSGTSHIIYSVGYAMQQLGYKILNDIVWRKPNPPPNLSCRYFTHSTEIILWAAKSKGSRHIFNYEQMRALAGGKQMQNVWDIYPPAREEKAFGKHPTQKPLALLRRIIEASTLPGQLILDPFVGSGSTVIAALELGRPVIGVDLDESYLTLAKLRIRAAIESARAQGTRGDRHDARGH